MISRRKFIKTAAITTAVATIGLPAGAGVGPYLNDKPMQRPQQKEGYLLFDAHSHVPNCWHYSVEDIARHLSTQATAVSAVLGRPDVMTYEDLMNESKYFKTVVPGRIATVEYEGNVGIIVKAQEVHSTSHHVQNIGADYVSLDVQSPIDAIKRIHAGGGLAIANHFFVTTGSPVPKITPETSLRFIDEIVLRCDESEVFNASAVHVVPGIDYSPNNFNSLHYLEALKKKHPFLRHKGIAVSDSHHELEASGMAGIYLSREAFKDFDALKYHIQNGLFERCEGNSQISRVAAMRGMFWNVLGN